jgi:hypothetical protein
MIRLLLPESSRSTGIGATRCSITGSRSQPASRSRTRTHPGSAAATKAPTSASFSALRPPSSSAWARLHQGVDPRGTAAQFGFGCRRPKSRECSAAARGPGFEPLAERTRHRSWIVDVNIGQSDIARSCTPVATKAAPGWPSTSTTVTCSASPAPAQRRRASALGRMALVERGVVPGGLDGLLRDSAGRCRGVVRRVSWWVVRSPGPERDLVRVWLVHWCRPSRLARA